MAARRVDEVGDLKEVNPGSAPLHPKNLGQRWA